MITAKIITLAIHNILRWVIVLLALNALIRTIGGWIKKGNWDASTQKSLTFYSISLDVQLLVGFLLYFLFSALTQTAFQDFGAAMGNQVLRFFTVEHGFYMIISLVLAHFASSVGKKGLEDETKFRRASIFLLLSVLLILAGIPWTRPLLPVF